MTRYRYKRGDRVVLRAPSAGQRALGLSAGSIGTVLDESSMPYVRWDGLGRPQGIIASELPLDVWPVEQSALDSAPRHAQCPATAGTTYLLRNVPNSLWLEAKQVARVRGVSLRALLIGALEREVRRDVDQ